jgi:hypothetical protein
MASFLLACILCPFVRKEIGVIDRLYGMMSVERKEVRKGG